MADPTVIPPTPPAAEPAWHTGLEDWPHLAASGWDKLDPQTAAGTIARSYRELLKMNGAIQAGNVVALPGAEDQVGQAAFWEKLGAPKTAAEYKLEGLTKADGTALDPSLVEAARAAAVAAKVPANMLQQFMAGMVPHFDQVASAAETAKTAQAIRNKAMLDAEWGMNGVRNHYLADRAMELTGVQPDTLKALQESPMGYAGVKKFFLSLAEQMGEAKFVHGSQAPGVLHPEQAEAKLRALMNDEAWRARWEKGGATEAQQKSDLIRIITRPGG